MSVDERSAMLLYKGVIGVRRSLQEHGGAKLDASLVAFEFDERVVDLNVLSVVFLVGVPIRGPHYPIASCKGVCPFHAEEVVVFFGELRQIPLIGAFSDDLGDRAAGGVAVMRLH